VGLFYALGRSGKGLFFTLQESTIMALKKSPKPTFKQTVEIPVPGEKPEKVEFDFHYMSKSAYKVFLESMAGQDDDETISRLIAKWPLNEVFGEPSQASVADLFDAYPGAPSAIFAGFVKGLHQGRAGN